MEHVYYRGTDDVDEIARRNPGYVRIYARRSVTSLNGIRRETIRLMEGGSNKSDDILYIVSQNKHESISDYFPVAMKVDYTMNSPVGKRIKHDAPVEIKKTKQTNILSYFVKKQ
ncbi:hypothetical protein ECANGB1_1340 [Enterospora canceri]|uniref:Uncharacterized protein n=1 Tax=Enterospora canceri TaxID=1081671 RepID=A0A1Y1S6B2_9MICR|nr:hypothetical protein ECANGB1_1340 [Enterospora canceri]